jgi:pimeloyl-ACP methyl ester carboxylesterase
MTRTTIHRIEADGIKVFYREAGPPDAPVVLLLHGFPTSSFHYRELIPRLADQYRVIAPDQPGFGFTEVPEGRHYRYTFDALSGTILAFTDALDLKRYALYVFDYGAPTGFRLAMARPEQVTAIVSQNGNAYEEGLGDAWAPIRRYWENPSTENRGRCTRLSVPMDCAGNMWWEVRIRTGPRIIGNHIRRRLSLKLSQEEVGEKVTEASIYNCESDGSKLSIAPCRRSSGPSVTTRSL